jgi:hypothetical protein
MQNHEECIWSSYLFTRILNTDLKVLLYIAQMLRKKCLTGIRPIHRTCYFHVSLFFKFKFKLGAILQTNYSEQRSVLMMLLLDLC